MQLKMKRIRDRKLTPLLKDQLATQEIRINEAGNNAYQDYINPKETGTMFSKHKSFYQADLNNMKKQFEQDFIKSIMMGERQTKEPIYASCPNEGQCFCTGACREIIGWREKTNTTLKDILNKH